MCRVQRKSVLQLAIRASCSPNITLTSPKGFLISRFDYTVLPQFEFSKKFSCPLGKLRTKFASPIAKSTSPGLSDTTFFAC